MHRPPPGAQGKARVIRQECVGNAQGPDGMEYTGAICPLCGRAPPIWGWEREGQMTMDTRFREDDLPLGSSGLFSHDSRLRQVQRFFEEESRHRRWFAVAGFGGHRRLGAADYVKARQDGQRRATKPQPKPHPPSDSNSRGLSLGRRTSKDERLGRGVSHRAGDFRYWRFRNRRLGWDGGPFPCEHNGRRAQRHKFLRPPAGGGRRGP